MRKILLLLSEGFEMLEASPFSDIFGWNAVIGTKDIQVVTGGLRKNIHATWNFTTSVDIILSTKMDLSSFDALVIPGGFGRSGFFKDIQNELFMEAIQHFHGRDCPILGICTGVFALGEAGILEGKRATTYLRENGRYFNQLQKYGSSPLFEEIVIHDNIITTSAPKTAALAAFILLEKLTSKENAEFIKREMGF